MDSGFCQMFVCLYLDNHDFLKFVNTVTYTDSLFWNKTIGYYIYSFNILLVHFAEIQKFCIMKNICKVFSFLEMPFAGFGFKVIWPHRMSWEALTPVSFLERFL